jgi:hypothetical protein
MYREVDMRLALESRIRYIAEKGEPRGPLSPEGSALQREPQELAHQVANPGGATTVISW